MKALLYEAPRQMRLRDLPTPIPGPEDAVIRVAFSGICGSELSGFLGQNSLRTPPLVFGHELAGHITAVGERVDTLEIDSPVTAYPIVSCGQCHHCQSGNLQRCGQRSLLGAGRPGCNAEFVVVPARCIIPLPADLPLQSGALAEPAACAVRAVELAGAGPRTAALVIGAGAIGLLILQVLAAHGVTTRFVTDVNPDRLQTARQLGAIPISATDPVDAVRQYAGRGVDVAFDAVGAQETRRSCLASVDAGGTVVLVGLHSDETTVPLNQVIRNETRVLGAFAYTWANFRAALDLLGDGRIGLPEGMVTAPLADGPLWYDRLVTGDAATKVLLRPNQHGELVAGT